jgi:putative transposase
MKTRKAFNIPGHAHELTFSCYRRLPLLSRDRTRTWVIHALARLRDLYTVRILAYVLMPEHVHVLLFPTHNPYDMSSILKSLKQPVARTALLWMRRNQPGYLSKLEGERLTGRIRHHFWQPGGGYDRNVSDLQTLLLMIDYIHANPVRRGLVKKPIDWTWSSARWYAGQIDVPLTMDPLPM